MKLYAEMTFILVLVFYMYDVCNCCAAAVREHRGGGEYHHQGTHLPGQRPTATRQAQHPADLLQIDDLLATGTTQQYYDCCSMKIFRSCQAYVKKIFRSCQAVAGGDTSTTFRCCRAVTLSRPKLLLLRN